jgi:V8-like Glu-specific endopeptidase
MSPGPHYEERLLDALLAIPGLYDPTMGQANRRMLLRYLPDEPVAAIPSFPAPLADLNAIVTHAAGMGQLLDSGEWALAIVTRNALRFARGGEPGRALELLLAEFDTRATRAAPLLVPEIVIGQDERLPVHFLERGLEASRSVAKVLVTRVLNGVRQRGNASLVSGTGWLVAPDLLLTNHHVVEARDPGEAPASDADFRAQAGIASVWFGYDDREAEHRDYEGWELVHASWALDYALLRFTSAGDGGTPLSVWGHLSVVPTTSELAKGDRLNIIQHPQGGPKRIAIRSNFYVDRNPTAGEPYRIRYLTDTEPGSSGSPVFDDDWRVVALHHAAVQVPEERYRGEVVKFNNQGVLLDAILGDMPDPTRGEVRRAQGW